MHLLITQRAEARAKREAALRQQLHQLYAPLAYLVALHEIYARRSEAVVSAGGEEYTGKTFAPDSREWVSREIATTIGVANEYGRQLTPIDEEAFQLIRGNYVHIDREDADIFLQFAEDHIRGVVEFRPEGGIKLPFGVEDRLGPVPLMRQAFRERVRERFALKRQQLAGLEAHSWWLPALCARLKPCSWRKVRRR